MITWQNANPNTVWNKLATKLGRQPTHAEAKAEVKRLLCWSNGQNKASSSTNAVNHRFRAYTESSATARRTGTSNVHKSAHRHQAMAADARNRADSARAYIHAADTSRVCLKNFAKNS